MEIAHLRMLSALEQWRVDFGNKIQWFLCVSPSCIFPPLFLPPLLGLCSSREHEVFTSAGLNSAFNKILHIFWLSVFGVQWRSYCRSCIHATTLGLKSQVQI